MYVCVCVCVCVCVYVCAKPGAFIGIYKPGARDKGFVTVRVTQQELVTSHGAIVGRPGPPSYP